jgi:hypothetical protein
MAHSYPSAFQEPRLARRRLLASWMGRHLVGGWTSGSPARAPSPLSMLLDSRCAPPHGRRMRIRPPSVDCYVPRSSTTAWGVVWRPPLDLSERPEGWSHGLPTRVVERPSTTTFPGGTTFPGSNHRDAHAHRRNRSHGTQARWLRHFRFTEADGVWRRLSGGDMTAGSVDPGSVDRGPGRRRRARTPREQPCRSHAVAHAELREDRAHVELDRIDADEETGRDLFI